MADLWVAGTPVPQGSKTAYVVNGRARLVDANTKLKAWRKTVTLAAIDWDWQTDQPVEIWMRFVFQRPKSVKRALMSVRPDADKLARAILDALTDAGVWQDDAMVVALHAVKEYAEPGQPEGVHIKVVPLD